MFKNDYESPSFKAALQLQQPLPFQIPDHLKCGEVYTWLCAGELYAVECKLCEDRPLCPLSEFPEHMEIWHTEWEEMNTERSFINSNSCNNEEEIQIILKNDLDNLNNDHVSSFITVDSGIFGTEADLYNVRNVTSHEEQEEIPQPFEQVLIEQDPSINTTTTPISADVNESEYFQDLNEQVAAAETGLFQIENKQQQKQTFVKPNLTMANKEQRVAILNEVTVREHELQHLTATKESNGKSYCNPANNCRIKQKCNKKSQSKKGKFKRKLTNFKINNKIQSETGGSETSVTDFFETKMCLKNCKFKTKCKQQRSLKLKEIQKALNRIIKDISDLKETDETESETSVRSKNISDSELFKTLTSMQKENLSHKTLTKTNVTKSETNENETNLLNKKGKLKITSKNDYKRKNLIKYISKTNKNNIRNFIKSKNKTRVFRKPIKIKQKNASESEQSQNAFRTSSETSPEHKTAECRANETQIMENQEKLSESVEECPGNETKNGTETKNNNKNSLKKNEKDFKHSKTTLKETDLKKIPEYLNLIEEKSHGNKIVFNKNETNRSKNVLKINQNESKTNKIEMERNGIEMGPNGKETEQNQMATKLNKNNIKAKKDQNNSNSTKPKMYVQIKKNYNKMEMNESETSVFNAKFNKSDLVIVRNKAQNRKFKAISNEKNSKFNVNLKATSKIETSENETISSNLKKYEEKSKPQRYQTRIRTRNSKEIFIGTNEIETLQNENETKLNLCSKEKVECENLVDENETQYVINNAGTNGNETNYSNLLQCLPTYSQTRMKAEKYTTKKLKQKSKGNSSYFTETNENETSDENIQQLRRKSCRIRKQEESLLEGNPIKPLKTNVKGTLRNETLRNNTRQISANVKDFNQSKHKTKSYESLKQTDGNETVFNNTRKSLRNIRKNPKYFENSLEFAQKILKTEGTNVFQTQHFKKEDDRQRKESEKGDKKVETKRQKFNEIYKTRHKKSVENKDPENLDEHEILQISKLQSSKEDEEFKTKYLKRSDRGQLKMDDLKNLEKIQKQEFKDSHLKSSKTITKCVKRNLLRKLCEMRKKDFKRRLRNSNCFSSFKQQLSTCQKKRESLKSNKKKAIQQYLEHLSRTRKRERRNFLCQAIRQRDGAREIKQEEESCTISVLTTVCEESNTSAKENDVGVDIIAKCEESNASAEENDAEDIFRVQDNRKVGRENNVSVKENEDQNVLKLEDNIGNGGGNKTLAKENDRANVLLTHKNVIAVDGKQYVPAKEIDDPRAQSCQEMFEPNLDEKRDVESCERTEQFADICSYPLNSYPKDNSLAKMTEPDSPLSPQTEEEHFEFYEPKEKLNRQHISHLIKLYNEHSRLWDQSHPDFCEPQLCRKSWQQITEEWNKYCRRKFSIAEVRIRICTLCQRFVQEKDRLALEGELDECAKFPYYEQMKFLEHQKSLRKRRELYEQQNEKILEIYQHFPILWHVKHYKSRQAKKRAEAFESISKVLKLFDLHLSCLGVQKRIRSLRKCYRLEKIRYLHAQVEQTPFDSEFRHYERMQFLDKHIDPFVCRVCGKIFEYLQGFREHLEAENHGSILQEDTDAESILDEQELEENAPKPVLFALDEEGKSLEFSSACSQMESLTESENSSDVLQRFTPFSSTPIPGIENQLTGNNPECFPSIASNESLINSLHLEDQLIEEIIGNVNNNDCFSGQGLDQFINSVTSCEDLTNGNNLFEEVFSSSILPTENHFVIEHPDVISDRASCILSPLTNAESLISFSPGSENSLLSELSNTNEIDHNLSVSQPSEDIDVVEMSSAESGTVPAIDLQPIVTIIYPAKELENQVTADFIEEKPSSSTDLVVKVQCADYSVNLKLNTEPLPTLNTSLPESDHDCYSSGDNSTSPLSDHLIHKMIELYRKFPQLWDPNHLDFSSRTLRRQAWVNLAMEFNTIVGKQLSWRTLHRKLTDYAKYYKKLVTEQENYENLENKWLFYEDFKFLDDVIAVNTELQRSVHHRDNNFKIIATYKSFPQLWNIKHPDFSKRSCKQRNIELMCNRLQEENNLQLTTERLKTRLIELRTQYRTAKKQRLKCLKNQQQFSASEFEFYEALSFLDEHLDPFNCDICKMEFKKLTDFNQHVKKEHSVKKRLMLLPNGLSTENVCHICGTKFTTRSNLVHHIKRHEGIRNYACTMCSKKFYASHALKVHIRSHTKECPYTCEKCGLSFVSASKLNQHVKRHLNQKDFECSYCTKAFFTAFEKDRHERRHLNIRDKVCPICSKTFVAGSSYYAHLMLHNDTKRFECDKCDMKFAQYPGLFKHKKRHHT